MTDTLPIVGTFEPVRAVKLAEVRGRRHPRMHPVGRYRRRHYEHVERVVARCHRHDHPAPTVACGCGFHGVDTVAHLPEVTRVLADSVVLDIELGGLVVEHEMGYRAEEQRVLGIRFDATCAWCRRPASHVVPGRLWRSSCERCSQRRTRSISRAEATATLGVDVSFVELPAEPISGHVFGAVRALVMWVVTVACLLAARRYALPTEAIMGIAACAATSFGVCIATALARSVRPHSTYFVAQCGLVFAASMVIVGAVR